MISHIVQGLKCRFRSVGCTVRVLLLGRSALVGRAFLRSSDINTGSTLRITATLEIHYRVRSAISSHSIVCSNIVSSTSELSAECLVSTLMTLMYVCHMWLRQCTDSECQLTRIFCCPVIYWYASLLLKIMHSLNISDSIEGSQPEPMDSTRSGTCFSKLLDILLKKIRQAVLAVGAFGTSLPILACLICVDGQVPQSSGSVSICRFTYVTSHE